MSHSVFKDQKKHQRFFARLSRPFFVGAASNLRKLLQSVNRFFILFSEQFLTRFSLALQLVLFRTRRAIIRTSACLATRFLNYFSEQFLTRFSLALQLVLFRTRRVIIRTSVCLATRFLNYFFRTISHPILTRFAARFVSNKAGDSTRIKKPRNFFMK
ncbi:MAG: hypothetical protein WC701_09495 [Kiritimatiellales bacterium]